MLKKTIFLLVATTQTMFITTSEGNSFAHKLEQAQLQLNQAHERHRVVYCDMLTLDNAYWAPEQFNRYYDLKTQYEQKMEAAEQALSLAQANLEKLYQDQR